MLIKIAWRNIWRNTSRSLTILIAIMIGLAAALMASAFSMGFVQQRFNNVIERFVSHIQIHNPEFVHDGEVYQYLDKPQKLLQSLSQIPEIKYFTERTKINGMIASAKVSAGVQITGIKPEAEQRLTDLKGWLTKGTYFEDVKRNPVYIGQELANKLKVDVGSRVVINFQDLDGDITAASFKVVGIFKTIELAFDEGTVFVRRSDLNSLLGDESLTHEIALILNDFNQTTTIKNQLQQHFPAYEVRSWESLSEELLMMQEMTTQSLIFLVFIILLGLGFGILNTMLMSVFERTRELGMLIAVGMSKMHVFRMIMLETLFLSFTGAITGMLSGFLLISWLGTKGINLAGLAGDSLAIYGYGNMIYPDLEPQFYFQTAIMVLLIAVLSALYPAFKALKLVPAEAVRKE